MGQDAQPSLAVIDSCSVKTMEVGGEHAFDGGKKINRRKRHILVDTMGNLLKVIAYAANAHWLRWLTNQTIVALFQSQSLAPSSTAT